MKLPNFHRSEPNVSSHSGKSARRKESFRTRAFRAGGYSVAAALIVLAIAVAANILAGALPSHLTQLDTTSNQLYSLSEQTETLVSALEDDVTIYWIVQSGQEDSRIDLLLDQYTALSDHLQVQKVDPDVSPAFVEEYELSYVYNNSFVVECADAFRYVSYADVYEYDYTTYESSFAGEGALTSAIDYVTSEDLPKLYTLTGHGESSLPSGFDGAVEQQNIETEELSLLTLEEVPEDADAILIYNPQSDLSDDEMEKLSAYLESGGNLLLITSPLTERSALANLETLMEESYGVSAVDGMVLEGDQNYTYWGYPYYLLPDVSSHDITSPLLSDGYYVLVPFAQGLTVADELPEGVSVSQLLTTSDSAYSKHNLDSETYEKEEGDTDGPFALAVAITDEVSEDTQGKVVWIASAYLTDDSTNELVSGGNQDFFLNSLSWMFGQTDSISIHAKSLSYDYLTIPSGTASLLTVLVVGILPLAWLGVGIYIWIRRKRR